MIILCIELCSMQQNKPRSDRRSIRREGSGEKSPLLSYFFGTTTINSVMGNSKRRRNLGQRQKEKKNAQAEREAHLQRTCRSVHEASVIVCRSNAVVRRGIVGAEDSRDRAL